MVENGGYIQNLQRQSRRASLRLRDLRRNLRKEGKLLSLQDSYIFWTSSLEGLVFEPKNPIQVSRTVDNVRFLRKSPSIPHFTALSLCQNTRLVLKEIARGHDHEDFQSHGYDHKRGNDSDSHNPIERVQNPSWVALGGNAPLDLFRRHYLLWIHNHSCAILVSIA